MTKTKTTIYWAATLFVAGIMTISGVLALNHSPGMTTALAHLGYPPYFSNLLGVAKLIGVCVILVPGIARLKEWAYVGFGITILSASYSHLLSGDGLMALEPLITFAALAISYLLRPPDRIFFNVPPDDAITQRDETYADEHQPIVSPAMRRSKP
jgi:hypothetical protein